MRIARFREIILKSSSDVLAAVLNILGVQYTLTPQHVQCCLDIPGTVVAESGFYSSFEISRSQKCEALKRGSMYFRWAEDVILQNRELLRKF